MRKREREWIVDRNACQNTFSNRSPILFSFLSLSLPSLFSFSLSTTFAGCTAVGESTDHFCCLQRSVSVCRLRATAEREGEREGGRRKAFLFHAVTLPCLPCDQHLSLSPFSLSIAHSTLTIAFSLHFSAVFSSRYYYDSKRVRERSALMLQ